MDLIKHASGAPLSAAEHQQRRDAARARWALGAGAGGGALLGGAVGYAGVARAAPREMANALHSADEVDLAWSAQRRATINETFARRTRATPDPAAPTVPVVGNKDNRPNPLVYDYQIDGLERKMKRTSDPNRLAELGREIRRLRRLAGKAPKLTARRSANRYANREEGEAHLALLERQIDEAVARNDWDSAVKTENIYDDIVRHLDVAHPVRAHEMRAFRPGGETDKRLNARIQGVKRELAQRKRLMLSTLEQRTGEIREATRRATIDQMERVLRRRMLVHAGRGGLIGAGIGLTAAGLGLLARHVIDTHPKKQAKLPSVLSKATPEDPQTSIGKGMAETYRAWIDRLLGRTDTPMSLGDSVTAGLAPGITQAFAEGATQPPLEGPEGPGYHVDVDFDRLNPSVRRHMADYALDRIVEISAQQRDGIRNVLMQQSVLQGIGPREVARSVREHIGLTAYQTSVVAGYRAELETLDPAALERKLRDARYDRTIRKAIESGTPLKPEQIDTMVDAYHRRMLAKRAETIARTESIRATTYGAVARAQDVLDTHPEMDVIKRWIATDDDRTRDTHRDLDGQEVQGMETPFKTTAGNLLRWPVDADGVADEVINCRCAIGYRFIPKTVAQPGLLAELVS